MRAVSAPLALALALAACNPQAGGDRNAARAPDREAAPAAAPATASPVPAPATPAPDVAASPPAGTSAEAAARLVERYYALLGAGRYREARRLWSDGGAASGMDAEQFARSFGRYATLRADVGAPGRVEGAAGSRYVVVPVRLSGQLRDRHAPFATQGSVTLRRAVVDGASPDQRAWHIHSADLKLQPPVASAR